MSKSLRERRREQALAAIARLIERRESILASLIATESKLRGVRRQVARLDKAQAKAKAGAARRVEPKPEPERAADDLAIPSFLQRQRDAEACDKAAADAIRAEQEERRRNKARVRIETMKARQSGASKQMPLQGKDALRAIHG